MFQIILSEREAENRLLVTLELNELHGIFKNCDLCRTFILFSAVQMLNKYLFNILCRKFLTLLNIIHITW